MIRFISWFVIASVGVGSSSALGSEKQQPEPKIYGVGVLGNCCTHGAGICNIFKNHPRTRVTAAFETNPRRAKELQKVFGSPLAGSYSAVIQHPEVDFVAVTCDPCDKPTMVEKAAAAGKPIFLNKPACASLVGARRIATAVEKHNVVLVHDIPMVRFIPVYARLLDEVRAGKHGPVLGYHHLFGMNFDPNFDLATAWPERLDRADTSGGGEMTNMGCYAIDFAASLFGRPKAVCAKWRKNWDVYKEADVENFGQIVLDYGDFFAFLEVGKQQLVGDRRHSNSMTVNFENKTFLIDASARVVTVNHVPQSFDDFSKGARAVGSVDQLIAAIEDGTPPSSSADTAVIATETLMAAYQSIVENRTVALPLASGANPLVAAGKKQPTKGATKLVDLGGDVTLELVYIPPGEFMMGSTAEERAWATGIEGGCRPGTGREKPEGDPRPARIKHGFWMGRTEVSVGQFKRFVEETGYVSDAEKPGGKTQCFDPNWIVSGIQPPYPWKPMKDKSWRDPNFGFPLRDVYPVVCVSWNDGRAFCRWLTKREREAGRLPEDLEYRLPTEAEWAYACRGGRQGTIFWWGNDLKDGEGRFNISAVDFLPGRNKIWPLANAPWSDGFAFVSPVDHYGEKGRNGFGLADMLGNVWEICLDHFDPQGAHEEAYFVDENPRPVCRGSTYFGTPGHTRCAVRLGLLSPSYSDSRDGFRICLGYRVAEPAGR